MYSQLQHPSWLQAILDDKTPAPKLYAWNLSNLDSPQHQAMAESRSSDDQDRRIFILGIGNLGRLFASGLSQTPERPPITLVVHRKDLLHQWAASEGIEILRNGALSKQKNFDIEWWTDMSPETGPIREVGSGRNISNLIITTKASAAVSQVDRLRRYLGPNSTVAFAQNGMSKFWPPHGSTYASYRYEGEGAPSFIACVTTHGVTSQGPFKSLHASVADVAIGPVLETSNSKQQVDYIQRQFAAAPFLDGKVVSRRELWILQLEKLVVNAIINPLTAILRCKNGELFTDKSGILEKIIDQLLGEASAVFQTLVVHESSKDLVCEATDKGRSSYDSTSLIQSQKILQERFQHQNLRDMVYRVGEKVKENTSSMLQDVRANKPTEVRDFNGWLVETAALIDSNLDVRGHKTLIELVESGKILDVNQLSHVFDLQSSATM